MLRATLPVPLGETIVGGSVASTLPLLHTEARGEVVGTLASIALTQHFANPFDRPVELLYRFAIPHRAALAGFELRVGGRRIAGAIAPREEATRLYQEALHEGHRAALATEERPNLYTVEIGNVQPGEGVEATYRYALDLEPDGGRFELALPFAVTPRYHRRDEPPDEVARTDVAVAPPGEPIGALDLSIAIDAGVPISEPVSPSHQIAVTRLDERRLVVTLVEPRVPTKDVVLRYQVASEDDPVHSRVWRASLDGRDVFYALLVPPASAGAAESVPTEYVFILDRSGSMQGLPIAQARNALRACLRTLGPADTFRIQTFDNVVEWFGPSRERALPPTDATLVAADAFLDGIEGRGGTELLPAVEAALELRPDPYRRRAIVLLTDGAVSAEDAVARAVGAARPRDRFFCFGIGTAVNRFLLDRLARVGRGAAEVVGLDEDIEEAIIRFQDRLGSPVLTDLQLGANGAKLGSIQPYPLPDLYAGQALAIVGELTDATDAPTLTLQGTRGGEVVSLLLAVPTPADEPLVRRLWARRQIEALQQDRGSPELVQRIVDLSTRYGVLTEFTAFLAVDRQTVDGAPPRKVIVAGALPEGLTFGRQAQYAVNPAIRRMGVAAPSIAEARMAMAPPPAPQARSNAGPLHRFSQLLSGAPLDTPPSAGSPSSAAFPKVVPLPPASPVDAAEQRRRELVRAQRASGGWGAPNESVELTAAAAVALARSGNTAEQGIFRRQVRRALDWLERAATSPDLRLFLLWARAEIAAVEGKAAAIQAARDEAGAIGSGASNDLAGAVCARLDALLDPPATAAFSVGPDPRLGVIAADPTVDARGLDLPWRACAAWGG